VPRRALVRPNESGPEKDFVGWAYCARTDDKKLFLLYFERDCPQATLYGAEPDARYRATWFDPRTGQWGDPATLEAGGAGNIDLSSFPDGTTRSAVDWALKLTASEAP
jgi:hypothetical protein